MIWLLKTLIIQRLKTPYLLKPNENLNAEGTDEDWRLRLGLTSTSPLLALLELGSSEYPLKFNMKTSSMIVNKNLSLAQHSKSRML